MSFLKTVDDFFQTSGFMPHGMCLQWRPSIMLPIVFGNAMVALSYFIIPIALIYLIIKRKDVGFKWMFVLFGAFILACGMTHVMGIITLWIPAYGAEAVVLGITGLVSLLTAILIWPLLPVIFKIPSPWMLEKANKALLQSNQELDDFAYIASHDLKEPLRGISHYASFLLEDYHDKLDDEGKMQLNTLKMLSMRMEDLLDDLLSYSRASRIDFVYQYSKLQEIIENRLQLLATFLKENNAEVIFKSTLPSLVCDKACIGEVFQNLIVNAVKYNQNDKKLVYLDFMEENDRFVFSIEDNGIGIPEEQLHTIFKIFKRLHARNEYGGGTGLGLTMAKKIIERSGGEIWVISKIGQGSTFYFSLMKNVNQG